MYSLARRSQCCLGSPKNDLAFDDCECFGGPAFGTPNPVLSASLSVNGHTFDFPVATADSGEFFLNGPNIQQIQTFTDLANSGFVLSTSFGFAVNGGNGAFSVAEGGKLTSGASA